MQRILPPAGKLGLSFLPATDNPPGHPRQYLPVSPGVFRAQMQRVVTLAGRTPAVALMGVVGYNDPPFRFPAELAKVAWEEFEAVPAGYVIGHYHRDWLPADHRLSAILAGSLDATIRREAQRAKGEYGGPLLMFFDWEAPNLGAPLILGDGWAWSAEVEAVQLEAEAARAPAVQLDGRLWPAGPALYVRAARHFIDTWNAVYPDTTWAQEMSHSWGQARDKPWMHPREWFIGDRIGMIGGGIGHYDWGDGNGPRPFAEIADPHIAELDEITEARGLPFFLEVGYSVQPGHPNAQADYFRQAWEYVRTCERLWRHGGCVNFWEDPKAELYSGTAAGQNAGMAIDATPDSLAAFRQGVLDPRLFGPCMRLEATA